MSYPSKFVDVDRYTNTKIHGAQGTIRNYWNVDVDKVLAAGWIGLTNFTSRRPTLAPGYEWVNRPDRFLKTSRAPTFMPEDWQLLSRQYRKKETNMYEKEILSCNMLEMLGTCLISHQMMISTLRG